MRQLEGADISPPYDPRRREWLVANGLGGFASATVAMALSRRYHALLVAAAGDDRIVLLSRLDDGLDGQLLEFKLDQGLPVWRLRRGDGVVERRVVMAHRANAVELHYRVVDDTPAVTLRLRPWLNVRRLEDDVDVASDLGFARTTDGDVVCISHIGTSELRLRLRADGGRFASSEERAAQDYPMEAERGYASHGSLSSPGWFEVEIDPTGTVFEARVLAPRSVAARARGTGTMAAERRRRDRLLMNASAADWAKLPPQLVLAADQFLVTSNTRGAAAADGVIAGYHWFGRWGRDTMISLEGLMLRTGRVDSAAAVLRDMAGRVRRGLIPNYVSARGAALYHTADATLWMFHALHRYAEATSDETLVTQLLPVLRDIVDWHLRGTDFNIGVDAADGLLAQGVRNRALTWMDAMVGSWVVTPRRGKAVELQALWYNALLLLAAWERSRGDAGRSQQLEAHAEQARVSFNQRFWNATAGFLYDVIDGDSGADSSCRPNQLFALSLDHPILDAARWDSVLCAVESDLVTPVGLRTLSPADPSYRPRYDGDRVRRDGAYHQGTVWPWLVGPYVDGLVRAQKDPSRAHAMVQSLLQRLDRMCVGQLNEIFDAEPPFTPRGCVAQAWSIAELIRAALSLEAHLEPTR